MAKNGDADLIQHLLREVSHIQDGRMLKILKASLEMQARLFQRMDALEALATNGAKPKKSH